MRWMTWRAASGRPWVSGPWNKEEDDKIVELVKALGAKQWSKIAQQLPGGARQTHATTRQLCHSTLAAGARAKATWCLPYTWKRFSPLLHACRTA